MYFPIQFQIQFNSQTSDRSDLLRTKKHYFAFFKNDISVYSPTVSCECCVNHNSDLSENEEICVSSA